MALQKIVIEGGKPLAGKLRLSGAKNAALPAYCASLLTDESCRLRNVPLLNDVKGMEELLTWVGAQVMSEGDEVKIKAGDIRSTEAPYEMVRKMRALLLPVAASSHASVACV